MDLMISDTHLVITFAFLAVLFAVLFAIYNASNAQKLDKKITRLEKERGFLRFGIERKSTSYYEDRVYPAIISLAEALESKKDVPKTLAKKLLVEFRLLLMIAASIQEGELKWCKTNWEEEANDVLERLGDKLHPNIEISLDERSILLRWRGLEKPFSIKVDPVWLWPRR